MKRSEISAAGLAVMTRKNVRTIQIALHERGAPKALRVNGNARIYNKKAAEAFFAKRALRQRGLA